MIKGQEITIPWDIFAYNKAELGIVFDHWEARPTGSDSSSVGRRVDPEDTYKVNDDVVFTAKFSSEPVTVEVFWDDGNNIICRLAEKEDLIDAGTQDTGENISDDGSDSAIYDPETENDNDPAGSKIAPLKLKSTKQTKKSVKITWTKLKQAVKYVIYGNKSGKSNKMKKLATVTGNTKTFKKIAGKKVKKGTCYIYAYAQNGVFKRIKVTVK